MHPPMNIPLALPGMRDQMGSPVQVLAGDVGGTKTNLALYAAGPASMELIEESSYPSAEYPSGLAILQDFMAKHPEKKPDRICLGVAGPVVHGKVEITNLAWEMDVQEVAEGTGISSITLINDLEATAYGLAALKDEDFIVVSPGAPLSEGNMAIIAPGTGLGEAGLYWDGKRYHPFPTEGGHADFGPRTPEDMELYKFLQQKYKIVSWEKVVAGPGIHDIFQFLIRERKSVVPAWMEDELKQTDPAAVISQAALEEKDPICIETMQIFVRFLARESSNLVLKMKATGGLFLAGGIPPKISPLLQQNVFYDNFLDNDRMQHLVRKVPIRIILNNKTALLGAAWYGAYGESVNAVLMS